jgi:ATP-dependent DNA ligase
VQIAYRVISPIHGEKMAAPYRPMLATPARALPDGEGWVHEAKLDGFRCLAQVKSPRLRLSSRARGKGPTSH